MKKLYVMVSCAFLFGGQVFAQQTDSVLFGEIGKQVAFSAALKSGDTAIPKLKVPKGFSAVLKGTDRLTVINADGKVFMPLENVDVSLFYQLKRESDQVTMDMQTITLKVPGQFNDQGKAINAKPFVIPALREWHGATGNFQLKKKSRIVLADQNSVLKGIADLLQKDLKAMNIALEIKIGKPAAGDIVLALNSSDRGLGEEGYELIIGDYLQINALHKKGAIWGTRTLLQLLEQDPLNHQIVKGQSRDYPKYAVRGLVLDVGRKFFTIDFLRAYVKMMSYYKMSEFHIHLNDNGFPIYFKNKWEDVYAAFRLESTTYPSLTAKDGHYTKKEFIALQDMADDYGVVIIPEIDVPAHSLAITRILPEIGSKKYGMDHLDLYHPKTYEIVSNIFKEYLEGPNPVFKGKVVHIGTDEYAKEEAEKFRYFTDYFIKYAQGFGKDVRVWGALSHAKGTTPVAVKGVAMNAWYNGYGEPRAMKKLGYPQISTPDGWLYIVPAAGYYYDYLNLTNLYRKWEPVNIGDVTFQAGDPAVIGGMFAVWNDKSPAGNGITEKDVHDRVFPALQVLSQKMWAGTDSIPFKDFLVKGKGVKEGPGVNVAGYVLGKDSLVLNYTFEDSKFKDQSSYKRGSAVKNKVNVTKGINGNALVLSGENSFLQLPLKEIGYGYTVSMWLKPAQNSLGERILFSSENGVVKSSTKSQKFGFSREGMDYEFNYQLPLNEWTQVVISGDHKGTSLYINGKLQEKMTGKEILFPDTKAKMFKVETLVFPLQILGAAKNGFSGAVDDLKVFNKMLSNEEISKAYLSKGSVSK
ncbi:family 20 glycosylhydrolase [Pedobacter sp. N36a]|uniref:family 20 glycosylhydrolase n=1 Tax=Pedobacter sp. N36a TaxID=2767996 RepID=UPI001656E8F8|nr:family 20 glycosylhydrolase [Pedobacter sp. N36a]MBC8985380.1 family 20 glycosylhydrolase [Pedobacter sp. N36a]